MYILLIDGVPCVSTEFSFSQEADILMDGSISSVEYTGNTMFYSSDIIEDKLSSLNSGYVNSASTTIHCKIDDKMYRFDNAYIESATTKLYNSIKMYELQFIASDINIRKTHSKI